MQTSLLKDFVHCGTEFLWPDRCVLCDCYGTILCETCKQKLAPLDTWKACPRCGSAYGALQCSQCQPYQVARQGFDTLPFECCLSAYILTQDVGRIVRCYKDKQALALKTFIAESLFTLIRPDLLTSSALCYIPASKEALCKRGLDHMQLISQDLSDLSGLPVLDLLSAPTKHDQRTLGRHERFVNMHGAFTLLPHEYKHLPDQLILIDDVFTTGATLFSASACLKAAFPSLSIHALSFARVF